MSDPGRAASPIKRPLVLDRKTSSAGLLPQSKPQANNYASDPTTAINFENADLNKPIDEQGKQLTSSSNSLISPIIHTSDDILSEQLDDEDEDEHDLLNILQDLMINEQYKIKIDSMNNKKNDFQNWNIFNKPLTIEEILARYIKIDKTSDDAGKFHDKFKQFFILSTAGKPIYSMNGSDDIVIGYMGLITTIVSTFQENMKEDFKSIKYGNNLKLSVLNKDPLLFVSITKLNYEIIPSLESQNDDYHLIRQLNTLYNYVLSILSKTTITKNFNNRMNYDLRKILTPLDFSNFDNLCMKLTYGLSTKEPHKYESGFEFFISELLGSNLQSTKISHTARSKLNSILLGCKKLKAKEESDTSSIFNLQEKQEQYISGDLLFSLLTFGTDKILTMMRPRNHQLTNDDIQTLLLTIQSTSLNQEKNESLEDLWIPLCMPNFNSNGFLYVFVKKFDLAEYLLVDGKNIEPQIITIILISGNKNSFFQMKEISDHIIYKIIKNETFRNKLSDELMNSCNLKIFKNEEDQFIKHFIYKLKLHKQFFMSDALTKSDDLDVNQILQLVYFYSIFTKTKSSSIKTITVKNKKLTYLRWQLNNQTITGFMLSDQQYEFYCLSDELIKSQQVINQSLKIIKWCEKNYERLFIGEGVCF